MSERKEKIETKGAYSHDLHEAIRDVRRAFANDNFSQVGSRLNALFDICAPEIREAINEEWDRIDDKYGEQAERYSNAKYEVTEVKRNAGWGTRYDGAEVYRVYAHYPQTQLTAAQNEERAKQHFLSEIWGRIYRERFRACIDCLDRHGELRKWREVEYGKV